MTETSIEELVRSLVTPLLERPDDLTITQSEDEHFQRYVVDVHPQDVGRLIGRQGHIASALRTVVEGARPRRSNSKKIRLLINDHRH
ncbi:KH domain-containing protein [Limosilactobacillus fastidiosus]|uniref:RNA-binding protein KhpA n=1 Tax=Limosilactobacillus fastidiosus TaxID=2759855 RepID=A0A7W3YD55_9LACO|nr:KH domain-containing protein [Limosilactobacillus fastidiosus]MBB1063769.1 KH domain-containing protein [Limosilactobacillus fastidiosus]MBB1086702.1 KH domain-containing protein [Limosilactobacillus fastidiosus]MCD7084344.1 KH domain-containing protein [Limosilactobacillus fastidiosus]MCD7085571.1 KH domain-containing protein [Limosilactobacillus fastidiosus]MCD7114802.1 KH domain-containing protein [Limosilactobacillus fastidiosus]